MTVQATSNNNNDNVSENDTNNEAASIVGQLSSMTNVFKRFAISRANGAEKRGYLVWLQMIGSTKPDPAVILAVMHAEESVIHDSFDAYMLSAPSSTSYAPSMLDLATQGEDGGPEWSADMCDLKPVDRGEPLDFHMFTHQAMISIRTCLVHLQCYSNKISPIHTAIHLFCVIPAQANLYSLSMLASTVLKSIRKVQLATKHMDPRDLSLNDINHLLSTIAKETPTVSPPRNLARMLIHMYSNPTLYDGVLCCLRLGAQRRQLEKLRQMTAMPRLNITPPIHPLETMRNRPYREVVFSS
jgi:hypothetical protein